MEIRLKEHVERQGMTIQELSEAAGIELSLLQSMYDTGEVDDKVLGVHGLSSLMIALDLTNVRDLVPKLK